MVKDSDAEVRSHNQERNWLVKLGNGNILEGIKTIVRQLKDDKWNSNDRSVSTKKKV